MNRGQGREELFDGLEFRFLFQDAVFTGSLSLDR